MLYIELDAMDGEMSARIEKRDTEIEETISEYSESNDASACCWHVGLALRTRIERVST